MIKVTIYQPDQIRGFNVIGHAEAGQYGHDIVCSAVSVLSITTTNGIVKLAGVNPRIQQDSVAGGLLKVRIPRISNSLQNLKAQVLLENFELGIKSIIQGYSQYVNLKIIK